MGTSGVSVGAGRTERHRLSVVIMIIGMLGVSLIPRVALAQTAPPPTAPLVPPADNRPAPDTTPPPGYPIPTVQAAPADPANVLPSPPAVAFGSPGQEVVDRRTASSKTFVGDHPGELRTEVYAAPVHYKDAQGCGRSPEPAIGDQQNSR